MRRFDDFGRPSRDASVSQIMSDRWRRESCRGPAFQPPHANECLNSVSAVCGVPFIDVGTSANADTLCELVVQRRILSLARRGSWRGGGGLMRLRRCRNTGVVQTSLFNYRKPAEDQNCSCCRKQCKTTAGGQQNKHEHHRSIMGA